jgi:hypothetical protein
LITWGHSEGTEGIISPLGVILHTLPTHLQATGTLYEQVVTPSTFLLGILCHGRDPMILPHPPIETEGN